MQDGRAGHRATLDLECGQELLEAKTTFQPCISPHGIQAA